jgi:hypothetical protein
MKTRTIILGAVLSALPGLLHAQFDFKLDGLPVQIHSFASQGFAYSNDNNFLTMKTSSGSFAMTDAGANISSQITDKFRVGAQFYIRNVGAIGNWEPQLDWASGDYRFKDWFGIRAGKVKTALGLYNDTQDMEFLQTWALMPQSTYPVDLRGNTIAHVGGDIYGNISMKKAGSLAYTVYGGQRPSDMQGGITFGLLGAGIRLDSYGGTAMGADLRWNAPLKGLMAGASYIDLNVSEKGTRLSNNLPYTVDTNKDHTPVFYAEYSIGNLRLDGEYRREIQVVDKTGLGKTGTGVGTTGLDERSGFLSAAYRVSKWLELGTYHSRFYPNWPLIHSVPANHLFDQAVTARFDLTSYLDLKVEGHFLDGAVGTNYYHGFYSIGNPQGLQSMTNMLVIRMGFHM